LYNVRNPRYFDEQSIALITLRMDRSFVIFRDGSKESVPHIFATPLNEARDIKSRKIRVPFHRIDNLDRGNFSNAIT
jgi:hypothetical protein